MRPPTLPPGSKGAQRRELAGTRRPLQGTPPTPPHSQPRRNFTRNQRSGGDGSLGFCGGFDPLFHSVCFQVAENEHLMTRF